MEFNIDDKLALVCASSAGIGKGIATRLVQEGCHVALLARGSERLLATQKELSGLTSKKVQAYTCDLSGQKDIKETLAQVEREFGACPDILINNQGGPPPGEITDISLEDLQLAYRTGLESVFTLCKLCLPSMQEKRWGRIINVLSISGKEPLPGMLLSNTIRPAVMGLAKSLANQYASFGITINSLLPANVLSDRTTFLLNKQAEAEGITFEQAQQKCAEGVPMKRMTNPNEFAAMAAFLASEQASFITGTVVPIDGGLSRSLT